MTEENLGEKVRCLNQVFRPETNSQYIYNCGNCTICTYDENNKYCKNNQEIRVKYFQVKEK